MPKPTRYSPAATAAALLCLLFLTAALRAAGDPLPRGQVVFETAFDPPPPLAGGPHQLVERTDHGKALRLERPAGGPARGGVLTRITLPAERVRGHTLYCYATVRGEGVSAKPQAWNGVKCMLAIEAPSGKVWPQAELGVGTFDWSRVAFAARVPADATAVTLCFGLEDVTGAAFFDDVRIVVGKTPPSPRPATRAAAAPPFKGHDLPRLRGAMIQSRIDEAGLRTLGQTWGANLIRWQLVRSGLKPGESHEGAAFNTWLDAELKRLDATLPLCEKYGLKVVIDLHSPPGGKTISGGYVGSEARLFTDRASQDQFVATWERIARQYKDVACVWAYDLVNEPVENVPGEGCDDWHALATRAARAVRAIDPRRALIVEPSDWGDPGALARFEPIDVPGVVYSVHMYQPHAFTHQGVHSEGGPIVYPGEIKGKRWDKAALAEVLRPAEEFQRAYGVHIFIGEFSAIRWAPDGSAHRYLRDVIELMEERGWDWTYHAFREWDGWSVEHGEDRRDRKPATRPTEREQLLRSWFAKNQKP